jgi:hypothetical protein
MSQQAQTKINSGVTLSPGDCQIQINNVRSFVDFQFPAHVGPGCDTPMGYLGKKFIFPPGIAKITF